MMTSDGEIRMQETVICKICLEPINSFLCIDCLGNDVHKWLSSTKPELIKDFLAYHKVFHKHFSSDENQEKCIKCGRMIDTVLCPYCYANEIFWLIMNKDAKVASKFAKIFNFDFDGPGYLFNTKTRNLSTIIIDKPNMPDMNICENCGQSYDNLKRVNGNWLCESCREL